MRPQTMYSPSRCFIHIDFRAILRNRLNNRVFISSFNWLYLVKVYNYAFAELFAITVQ